MEPDDDDYNEIPVPNKNKRKRSENIIDRARWFLVGVLVPILVACIGATASGGDTIINITNKIFDTSIEQTRDAMAGILTACPSATYTPTVDIPGLTLTALGLTQTAMAEPPTATYTLTCTPTSTATWTPTPSPSPSDTPTYTPTSTSTDTPTPSLTSTYTPTGTSTDTPTPSPTYTSTPTFTPIPSPTNTHTPTLTSTSSPTTPPPSIIAEGSVNVRSGPGISTTRIGTMQSGETATVLSKTTCGGYVWWEIAYNNLTGWVRGDLVTTQGNTDNVLDNPTVECPPEPVSCQVPLLSAWTLADPSTFTAGTGTSYGSYAGRLARRLTTSFQAGVGKQAAITTAIPLDADGKGYDWTACTTIAVYIYVPPEFQYARARIAIQTGNNYLWFQMSSLKYVKLGEWDLLTATLRNMTPHPQGPASPDLTDVRGVFVVFFNDQVTLSPELYISGISVY